MSDINSYVDEVKAQFPLSETEQKWRYGIGSAAAATAIFAPLNYTWKGVLTGVAAITILSGIYGFSPVKKLLNA